MVSILVTAGPTLEYLDDVRFLANGSSGRMGHALTAAALARGHRVTLISGPTSLAPPAGAALRPVTAALEMAAAVDAALADPVGGRIDLVLAVAAVADYRPAQRRPGKLARGPGPLQLELLPNPDILAGLGRRRARGEIAGTVLVGFALEAGDHDAALARAAAKLAAKQIDLIVLNHVSAIGAADNEVTLLYADGRIAPLPRGNKAVVAEQVLTAALALVIPRSPDAGTPSGTRA